MSNLDALRQEIEKRAVILFVGSGVSATLGMPTYAKLIDHLAEELGYDSALFAHLGKDFLELAEYYVLETGSIGPLRSWMDTNWHVIDPPIQHSKIHEYIVDLKFPIIYTTNYDRWIERAFDHHKCPYVKIATVKDFVKPADSKTQIIKFHGDFDHEETIVLTESSFFERLDFESPLDLKLRSDCLGKSLLFLGYSLSDINLRLLLFKLNRLWNSSKFPEARPRSYLFSPSPNPVQERLLRARGVTFVSSDDLDAKRATEDFLEKLRT